MSGFSSSGAKSNVINDTRDLTTASGTQDVTGFGFDPTSCSVNFAISVGTLGGVGFASSSGNQGCSTTLTDSAVLWIRQTANGVFASNTAGTASQAGVISFITDGIRITWTKTGSPTGTLGMTFLGQR